jgi:stage IV sporulation protein FB
MFGAAAETPYDLRFRLLDVPIRIHPLFWLIMAMLSRSNDLGDMLIFIGCAFVSILLHEFGHGLSARGLGFWPREIVLYGMGGYCECEFERQRPWQKLIVLFCGPGAGLLFAGVLWGGYEVLGEPTVSRTVANILEKTITINLAWSILNLFPIWPMDGGRILEVVLSLFNDREGSRRAHIVSLLAAGGLALFAFKEEQTGLAFWFIYFAFINYQELQSYHQSTRFGSHRDW